MARARGWMVALIVCAGLCTRASAQELITNGGFENTDEDGVVLNWVYSGEGVGPATSAAHSGFLGMEFFSYGEPATLTQDVVTGEPVLNCHLAVPVIPFIAYRRLASHPT